MIIIDTILWLLSAPFVIFANRSKRSLHIYYSFVKFRRRLRGEPEWQEQDWKFLGILPPKYYPWPEVKPSNDK